MNSYPTKYSVWTILGIVAALVLLFFVDSRLVAILLGSGAATLVNPPFIVIALLLSLAVFSFPPVLLGLGAGLIYKAFLHLTLQDHWAQLGISPSFFDGLIKDILVGILFVSVVHVVAGKLRGSKSGEKP
jgi:hypothetical protein